MSEEETFDFGEGQNADDPGVALGDQIVRSMPEARFDDVLPPDAMKERGIRAAMDELVPARAIVAA